MIVCMMVMMFGSLYIIGRALYRWRQQGWLKRKVDMDDAFTDVDVDASVGVGSGRLSGTVGSGVRIRCGKLVVETNTAV